MGSFDYDEIDYWSEVKLDIVRKYATAYSVIMNAQSTIKKHIYIDAFAGAGRSISRRTGQFVAGSPLNALNVKPPFKEIHLIDLHGGKVAELKKLAGERSDVFIYESDANKTLLEEVFPRCRWDDRHRALCLLDPYKLNVNWEVLKTAGQMGSVEVFYNFMIMDANRNVLLLNPDKVAAADAAQMDKAWGDRSWRDAAYQKRLTMFGDTVEQKAGNEVVAEAFRKRLQDVAGFKYVPKPIPMRNRNRAIIYYLFFASPNEKGASIVEDIFKTYRDRGMH